LIEDLVGQLMEASGEPGAKKSVVLYSPSWTYVDRADIELLAHGRKSRFLAKMARFPVVSRQIQHEAMVLMRLRDMQVRNIPEVVLEGSSDGRAFLVERLIQGEQLEGSRFSETEKLRLKLDWMKGLYSRTLSGELEPQELIGRVEKVREPVSESADLSEVLEVLEECKPEVNIPSVCRQGDPGDSRFLYSGNGVSAVEFGFSNFDEPPVDPYTLVQPVDLKESAKDLDLLSSLGGVNPFFLAMYANAMHLGEHLRIRAELQEHLLSVGLPPEELPSDLEKMRMLLKCYHEFKK
jgi:hypothetical protein